mgnify:CR=1 FL=1
MTYDEAAELIDAVLDDPGPEPELEDRPPVRRSAAELLVELALERYRFGCTVEGDGYAVPTGTGTGGHVVRTMRGGQVSLRSELAAAYRQRHGKVAAQQALADALLVLEGIAQEAEPEQVALRVAPDPAGGVWIDLGDKAEHVVRVTAAGWRVTREGVPVRFRRTKLTGALPMPDRGGSLEQLWELLNVAPADRPLLLGWLVAALVCPDIPHPVLALFGEQGTGKSSASRLLVALTDPSPVPVRKPPRDPDGWVTAAAGSWVVGLDNLSEVRDWFSDSLCRAVTGEGDIRRKLYTDGELSVFGFRRCILLNGIDVGALRGDLADRALVVTLDRLGEDQRRTESELAERWAAAYPRIVGALLTEAAEALAHLPSVRLGSSPRMADFARVLAALDARHGTDGLGRYTGQARTLAEDTLDADVFLTAMRSQLAETFTGTAAELLQTVTHDGQAPRDWPKGARALTGLLRRNAPSLRKAGWRIDEGDLDPDHRAIVWHLRRPEIARIPASGSSVASETPRSTEPASQPRHANGQSQDGRPTVSAETVGAPTGPEPVLDPAQPVLDLGSGVASATPVAQPAGGLLDPGACRGCGAVPGDLAGLGRSGYCVGCEDAAQGVLT